MSNKFRIGKKEYTTQQPAPMSFGEQNALKKVARELDVARQEGHFWRQGSDGVSHITPKKAFQVIAGYIKKHQRKIYGGTALNLHLPKDHKIYKKSAYPDYDFFSPDPWKDAVAISDLLFKAGYKYTDAKAGLHNGTFKVFADFWPVADITYLPPDLYERVPTNKINGFTVVSTSYLQMTLYDLISKPIESPVRWPQVAMRQKLLEKWSPPKFRKKQCAADFVAEDEEVIIPTQLQDALEIVYTQARKKKLVHYGALAYNKYVAAAGGKLRIPVYFYELLTEKAEEVSAELRKEISKELPDAKLVSDLQFQPVKDMNPLSYILKISIEDIEYPIFIVTELTRCVPYKYLGGRYYCSIDYLFYELYNQMFNEDTDYHAQDVSCLIRYLGYVQKRYYKKKGIKETDPGPLQRFVTKCRGPYVDVVRKAFYDRWVDKMEAKHKIRDVYPTTNTIKLKNVKDTKIRIYPSQLYIPPECADLGEEDCKYPCTWNDKCIGIPFTGYQPASKKDLKK